MDGIYLALNLDIIMNTRRLTLAIALTLGAAAPALAGPDFQIIEQGRTAKRALQTVSPSPATLNTSREPLVLPLDHGPRAQTAQRKTQMRLTRSMAWTKSSKSVLD